MLSPGVTMGKISNPRLAAKCRNCGKEVMRRPVKSGYHYCNIGCKAEWQRTQKPCTREWLFQKYVIEGLGCPQIAVLVDRDPKSVLRWLNDFGIETRPRGTGHDSNPSFSFWNVPGGVSPWKGRRHTDESRRLMSENAKAQGRIPFDPKVGPPFRGKRGAEIPSWKGGVTPQRQAFYSTAEWKSAVKFVWRRDDATCQKCGTRSKGRVRVHMDIHHIVSFACVHLRAEVSNLVLLCEPCHYFVHSSKNVNQEFIQDYE